eukprot:TRINITY_DN2374_c0_g1_i10.p1 TRINITY_DN2374_c0_g1~~TRINITY_DN2374_c0_g1_i10.p1  ORF type:complete len:451 (-),score=126.59 TRINITY_DN2374_c0_g1_i10:93-1445(-)
MKREVACCVFVVFLSLLSFSYSLECQNEVDIVLVLDGSGSISSKDFTLMVDFTLDLIETIVNEEFVHVGVIQFSNTAAVVANLSGNITYLVDNVKNMKQMRSGTYLGYGISLAEDNINKYGRPDAPHIQFILTDGASSGDYITPSVKSKNNGTELYAIGVGNGVDYEQLALVVSPPVEDHVYDVTDFDEIKIVLGAIINQACVSVTDIQPSFGDPGNAVVITGNGFTEDTEIRIGDNLCENLNYVNSNTVSCNIPENTNSSNNTVKVQASIDGGETFSTNSNVTFEYDGCPNDCSGNGICVNGQFCQCNIGYTGPDCGTLVSPTPSSSPPPSASPTPTPSRAATCYFNCYDHGTCVDGKCQCDNGYIGDYCKDSQLMCCMYCANDPTQTYKDRADCYNAVDFHNICPNIGGGTYLKAQWGTNTSDALGCMRGEGGQPACTSPQSYCSINN